MDSNALKTEFLVESLENLSTINEDLTLLEKDPNNSDLLNKVYRTVHTMKGSASFLGYKKLQDLTHSAENLLDELREGNFHISPTIIDTLLESFDLCHGILKAIELEDNEGSLDIEENKKTLEKLLNNKGQLAEATAAPTPTPAASEPGQAPVQEAAPSTDAPADDELGDLISGHMERATLVGKESDASAAAPAAEVTPVTTEPEDPTSGEGDLSSAALDSLKELVDSGKMDASALADLQAMEAEAPAPEVKKEEPIGEAKPEPKPEPKPAPTKTPNPVMGDGKKSIADSVVRVNVKVLDKIMNIVGELVLNRNQILQFANSKGDSGLNKLSQQLNIITSELQSEVMCTRMQPIGSILTKFERLVRDFSRQSGKQINLKLSGQETELDKTLIEAIKDPLVHIIRNACDHGLEAPHERELNGKGPEGTIMIKSYNESGQVTIEIVDDGRGLNRDKIGGKALEKGIITQEQFERMSDTQVYGLIFAPGFSTAEKITNISGRGVGMDVVKTNIEKIGGSVVVNSEFGVGTTFKLRIPLTLAIVPALIIKSSNESFAIPQLNLVELVRLETKQEKSLIQNIQGSEFLKLRGELTPVFRLENELKLKEINEKTNNMMNAVDTSLKDSMLNGSSSFDSLNDDSLEALNIVIMNTEDHYFGIIVDEILDTEEIVVKPLNNSLKKLNLFGGATIMGDGKVALILDALGFLNTVSDLKGGSAAADDDVIETINEQLLEDGAETQENLLFRLEDDRVYAVPLSLVARLEEFSSKKIETTGNQPIVRYLDAPMPLIDVEKTLQLDAKSAISNPSELKSGDETLLNCIVTTVGGKNFGIIVKEIMDISIDKVLIDDVAVDREGILGTIFIGDKTISLVDLFSIIEKQNLGTGVRVDIKPTTSNFKKRILLVEDSSMYRKMIGDTLKNMGFQVDIANHGKAGFDTLEKDNCYDLIISDIEMPFVNGFELAEKIRKELKDTETPIVALSTLNGPEHRERGVEAGFNYHLEKFNRNDVVSLVNRILSGE